MRKINYYGLKSGLGIVPLKHVDTADYNERGFEIFWSFNEFSDFGKRKKEDLIKIHAIFIDIDGGDKESQQKKIIENLKPSLVVETKNGYHLYWYLDEPIDCSENPVFWSNWYRDFVKKRFIKRFNADPQACDATRLLRPPYYRYWKDGEGEFRTTVALDNETSKYSIKELEKFFPEEVEVKPPTRMIFRNVVPTNTGDSSFWNKANSLPVEQSLIYFSGKGAVCGEVYTFKEESGLKRIYCNGKKSNAWIDKDGKIGSTVEAGPSIPNWLYYYNKDWSLVSKILKEEFGL